jgi:hypothetical protein
MTSASPASLAQGFVTSKEQVGPPSVAATRRETAAPGCRRARGQRNSRQAASRPELLAPQPAHLHKPCE